MHLYYLSSQQTLNFYLVLHIIKLSLILFIILFEGVTMTII